MSSKSADNSHGEEDRTGCPCCGIKNSVSAEYCTSCGTPMAIITRVVTLNRARDSEPLETWRIYGIETQMVGRDREMQDAFAAYRRVLNDGEAQTICVSGATGLGKSRFCAEFARRLDEEITETRLLRAVFRDEQGGRFAGIARLFRDFAYIGENDSYDETGRKFLEAVASLVGSAASEQIAHTMGRLIGIEFDSSPHVPTPRDTEGALDLDARGFDAVVKLLAADIERNPVVMVLEDLEHATEREIDLIVQLQGRLADSSFLLMVSVNSDAPNALRLKQRLKSASEVRLEALSDAEVGMFVTQTLRRSESVPDTLIDRIIQSANGNPLSVEEILRILISQGVIDTRGQDWKIDEDKLEKVELPSTVQGTVSLRLHALTADERNVLEMASCIGPAFWLDALRCLYRLKAAGEDEEPTPWTDDQVDDRLTQVLESLERKDMIRFGTPVEGAPCAEMHFKHGLERTHLYDNLKSGLRERYHGLIAQWINWALDARGEERSELIAYHFERAKSVRQAAAFFLDAARQARLRYETKKAISLFVKSLSYLGTFDITVKLESFQALGELYTMVGEFDHAIAYFHEMKHHAWLINDRHRGALAFERLGESYLSLGEYEDALSEIENALTFFREMGDIGGIASSLDNVGKVHWIRGDSVEALRCFESSLELRREEDDPSKIATSLNQIGSVNLQYGDVRTAMLYFKEALALRKDASDKRGVVGSYNNLGVICMERGNVTEALALFEEAIAQARAIGFRAAEAALLNNLGEARLMLEETSAARKIVLQALKIAEETGEKRVLFDITRNLGKIDLAEGDKESALERLGEADEIAMDLDSPALRAMAKRSLGDVYSHFLLTEADEDKAAATAEMYFREAIDIFRDLGNESELARTLLAFGQFLQGRGEDFRATQYLDTAKEISDRLHIVISELPSIPGVT